jgi:hypothetical protein
VTVLNHEGADVTPLLHDLIVQPSRCEIYVLEAERLNSSAQPSATTICRDVAES